MLRQDLVDHPNMFLCHDTSAEGGVDDLTFIEVWENRNTGVYFMWDKENSEFRKLLYGPYGGDFMDVAEAYEEKVIKRSAPARRAEMRAEIANNPHHRVTKRDRLAGPSLDSIPGGGGGGVPGI